MGTLNKATSQWKMNENDPYPVGLVARWPFNDNLATTAVVDLEASPANGTFGVTAGSANTEDHQSTTKEVGTSALVLATANDELVSLSDPAKLRIEDAVSFAIWTKANSGTSVDFRKRGIYSKRNAGNNKGYEMGVIKPKSTEEHFPFYFAVDGLFNLSGTSIPANSVQSSIDSNDGEWHHVVGTYGEVAGWEITNDTAAVIPSGATDRLMENIEFDSVTNKFWWCMTDLSMGPGVLLAYSDGTGETKVNIEGTWTVEGSALFTGISPCLRKFGSKWYIYYKNGVTNNMEVRSSTTVNSGYGDATVVLEKGGSGSWEEERVDEPYVFLKDGIYHMLYMGEQTTPLYEKTGLATSTGPDTPFTKYANNPVMSGSETGNHWDSGLDRAVDPYAFQLDTESDVWYVGVSATTEGKSNWDIGFFSTTDFINYTPVSEANPILRKGVDGTWDDQRLVRGAAIKVEDQWYIAYTGHDGTSYKGGIATLDLNGSSSIIKMYIDGVWDAENANPDGTLTDPTGTNAYFGLSLDDNTEKYDGDIDDCLIFNTRLTDAEVLALYNSKHHTKQPDAIGDNDALASLEDVETKSVASTGDMGRAQTFDGTNDHFIIADDASLNFNSTPFTVAGWIKPSTVVGNADIISKTDGTTTSYTLIRVGGVLRFYVGSLVSGNSAISTTTMLADRWYFIVGVYDGTNTKIYVNGEFEANADTTIPSVTTTHDLILGARYAAAEPDYADNEFAGDMDNVMIYNLALNATEISELYNDGEGIETEPQFISGNRYNGGGRYSGGGRR